MGKMLAEDLSYKVVFIINQYTIKIFFILTSFNFFFIKIDIKVLLDGLNQKVQVRNYNNFFVFFINN